MLLQSPKNKKQTNPSEKGEVVAGPTDIEGSHEIGNAAIFCRTKGGGSTKHTIWAWAQHTKYSLVLSLEFTISRARLFIFLENHFGVRATLS